LQRTVRNFLNQSVYLSSLRNVSTSPYPQYVVKDAVPVERTSKAG